MLFIGLFIIMVLAIRYFYLDFEGFTNKKKCKCKKKSNNIDSDNSKGVLFLYPETGGFEVKDFGGFPPADQIKKSFHTIAIIGNHAAGDKYLQAQFNNPKLLQLQKETGIPIVHWMAYYFGNDSSLFCDCNIKGCVPDGTPQNCDSCKQKFLQQIHNDIQKYNLVGILFDDEVGDPSCIVEAMESAKDKYPSLQLGWTKSLGNASQPSPSNLGKMDWDICLGQAYTDNTTNLYSGSCNFAENFWNEIIKTKYNPNIDAGRGVPMVCGSGNCQEIDGCIDERMTGQQIAEILAKRPPDSEFKWRNFGIWYGTYANPSNCNNSGQCCTVKSTNNNCENSCCDDWAMA